MVNVELYNYNGTGAQHFVILKADKAVAGNLQINPGNSNTETKFSWDEGENCTLYNLRIRKGSPGKTTPYLDKWNLTDTVESAAERYIGSKRRNLSRYKVTG